MFWCARQMTESERRDMLEYQQRAEGGMSREEALRYIDDCGVVVIDAPNAHWFLVPTNGDWGLQTVFRYDAKGEIYQL